MIMQMYFIDHDKNVHLQDLELIISSETLTPGSIVVADNVDLGPISGGKNEWSQIFRSLRS